MDSLSHPLSDPFALPITVVYRDHSSPFAIEATVTAWTEDAAAGRAAVITLTIGSGTLHDADKGPFPIDGLAMTMRVAHGRIEPEAVLNPGVLSEFQQEGLLDAVSSYLNDVNRTSGQDNAK